MKILFSTGSLFYLPIKDIFSIAKEAGFEGCDLLIDQNFNDDCYIDTVIECLDVLPVYSIHAPFLKIKAWGNNLYALMRAIDVAKRLKVQVVNFHPPSWYNMEINFFKWFKKVKDFQKELECEQSLFLTIENMPLIGKTLMLAPYVLNNFEDLIAFGMERNLYFTFDTTHLGTFESDLVAAFLKFLKTERLKNVHVSDYAQFKSHLFIGRGELPIVKLLNTMRRLGYDEMVTLEVGPHELPRTREWLVRILSYELSFLKLQLGKA